jgi:hypothetical protein
MAGGIFEVQNLYRLSGEMKFLLNQMITSRTRANLKNQQYSNIRRVYGKTIQQS